MTISMYRHIFNNCSHTFIDLPLTLQQLQTTTQALTAQAFRQGTTNNHLSQAQLFMQFSHHYDLQFLNLSAATLCYYITFVSYCFFSATCVCNYVSGVRFLHVPP